MRTRNNRWNVEEPRKTAADPFWIQKWVLYCFCALFVALTVSLVIIWWRISVEDGFVLSITKSHYAWTYGPVALLTIMVSLWRQVDYCCKIIQPWQELRKGYAPARLNVLLDYLWPLQTTSLYRAFRNRHWAVAASTSGHLILKILVTISTTLFVLKTDSQVRTVPARINNAFSVGDFWSHVPSASLQSTDFWYGSLFTLYPGVSADPVWSYLSFLDERTAGGKTSVQNLAYQNFSVDLNGSMAIQQVTAAVELFSPNITCQVATTDHELADDGMVLLTLGTPTCSVGHQNMVNTTRGLFNQSRSSVGPCNSDCQDSTLFINVQRVNCSDQGQSGKEDLSKTTGSRYQYAFIAVDTTTQSEFQKNSTARTISTVERVTAVFCEVKYSFNRSSITQTVMDSNDQISIASAESPNSSQLAGLTDLQFSELMFSTLFYAPRPDQPNVISEMSAIIPTFFSLMIAEQGDATSIKSFLDEATMARSVKSVLEGLSTKMMLAFFQQPSTVGTLATVSYQEKRLYVRSAAMWIMVGLLVLAATMPIIIVTAINRGSAPYQFDLLASSLLVLALSTPFHNTLQRCGGLRGSQMCATLDEMSFMTTESEPFMIRVSVVSPRIAETRTSWVARRWRNMRNRVNSCWNTVRKRVAYYWITALRKVNAIIHRKPESSQKLKVKADWMPYSARRHAVFLTLLLPLLLICILEILFRLSQQRRDFVTVTSDSSVEAYAIRYSSVLILFAVATLYNSLDFTMTTLASFSTMRRGDADAISSLYYNAGGKLPPIALWINIRQHHMGPAMAIMASFIGSILTVIVSGLWVVSPFIVTKGSASASKTNDWDLAWNNSETNDNGAGALFNRVQHNSAVPPELIQGDLVLTSISDVALADSGLPAVKSTSASLNYSLTVPALRPRLDCEILPESVVSLTGEFSWTQKDWYSNITAVVSLPNGCYSYGTLDGDPDYVVMHYEDYISLPNDTKAFGQVYNLEVDARPASSPQRCPSLGILLGTHGSSPEDEKTLLTAVCYQRIEQVQALVKYRGPLLAPTIDDGHSVTVDAKSVVNMTNVTSGAQSFSYKVVNHTDAWSLFVGSNITDPGSTFDFFFYYMMARPGGISLDRLLQSRRTNELCVAMDKLYREFMVYTVDLNFRTPIQGKDGRTIAQTVSGTFEAYTMKLKVNEVSKIVLQAMLAAMEALGGLVYMTAEIRGTVPRSPCSIASTAAFFAGSVVSKRVKDALEADTSAQIPAILRAGSLSLGFWKNQLDAAMEVETLTDSAAIVSHIDMHNAIKEEVEQSERVGGVQAGEPLRGTKHILRFGIDMGLPLKLGYSDRGNWWKRVLSARSRSKN